MGTLENKWRGHTYKQPSHTPTVTPTSNTNGSFFVDRSAASASIHAKTAVPMEDRGGSEGVRGWERRKGEGEEEGGERVEGGGGGKGGRLEAYGPQPEAERTVIQVISGVHGRGGYTSGRFAHPPPIPPIPLYTLYTLYTL